jgi:hypothetical protein
MPFSSPVFAAPSIWDFSHFVFAPAPERPMKRTARTSPSLLIPLDARLPAITLEDLGLMLEIDLALGQRDDFLKRLRRALRAYARAQERKKTRGKAPNAQRKNEKPASIASSLPSARNRGMK